MFFHLELDRFGDADTFFVDFGGVRTRVRRHTDASRSAAARQAPHLSARLSNCTHVTETDIAPPDGFSGKMRVAAGRGGGDTGEPWDIMLRADVTPAAGDHVLVDYMSTAWSYVTAHLNLATKDPQTKQILDTLQDNGGSDDQPSVQHDLIQLARAIRNAKTPYAESQAVESYPGSGTTVKIKLLNAQDPQTGNLNELGKAYQAAVSTTLNAVRNTPDLRDRLYRITDGTPVSQQQRPASAVAEAPRDAALVPGFVGPDEVSGITFSTAADGADSISITLSNVYQRWLGLDVTFNEITRSQDLGDVPVQDISETDSLIAQITDAPYCQPCGTFLGVSTDSQAATKTLDIPLSLGSNVIGVNIYCCSLGLSGSADRPDAKTNGDTLTFVFNLMIPGLFLALAVEASKSQTEKLFEAVSLEAVHGLLDILGEDIGTGDMDLTVDQIINFAEGFWKLVLKETAGPIADIAKIILSIVGEREAANAVPVIGEILAGVAICAGTAQLVQTNIQLAMSDTQVKKTITFAVEPTIRLCLDGINGLPDVPPGTTWELSVTRTVLQTGISGGQCNTVTAKTLTDVDVSAQWPLTLTLPAMQADGAMLTFNVQMVAVIGSGRWIAATGASAEIQATSDGLRDVEIQLQDTPVPLVSGTTYDYAHSLAYQDGKYEWHGFPAGSQGSTATRNSPDFPGEGNEIRTWTSFDYDRNGKGLVLGYFATGTGIADPNGGYTQAVNAVALVSIPKEDGKGDDLSATVRMPARSPSDPTAAVVACNSTAGPGGDLPNSFVLDPTSIAQGYYSTRAFSTTAAQPFADYDLNFSWASFPTVPSQDSSQVGTIVDAAMHPEGHLIAVDGTYDRLLILPAITARPGTLQTAKILAAPARPQPNTPVDSLGLLANALAVSVSFDGVILTLEQGLQANGADIGPRIQAWDVNGNPSKVFADGGTAQASAHLTLDPGRLYTDICAIGTMKAGYVYVASAPNRADAAAADCTVEVMPFGDTLTTNAPIITRSGVPAARIAVDDLHQLYVMEYQMVTDTDNTPAGPGKNAGPSGSTVPRITKYFGVAPKLSA